MFLEGIIRLYLSLTRNVKFMVVNRIKLFYVYGD